MNAKTALLELIRRSNSPLLTPRALSHSQELGELLPETRRHLGPRPWYQALEVSGSAPLRHHRNEQ